MSFLQTTSKLKSQLLGFFTIAKSQVRETRSSRNRAKDRKKDREKDRLKIETLKSTQKEEIYTDVMENS